MAWVGLNACPATTPGVDRKGQVNRKGQPYYTRRDAAHHRPGCWEVSRDARKSRVAAGVAGKEGGDACVARRPVLLALRPCPPSATQASPPYRHTSPAPTNGTTC